MIRLTRPDILVLYAGLVILCAAWGVAFLSADAGPRAKEEAARGDRAGGWRIDLNRAPWEDLILIDGIGAAGAERIVAGRPFASHEDLFARVKIAKRSRAKIAAQTRLGEGTP